MLYGWHERFLDVNLTSGAIATRTLPRQTCIDTIGGIGLAAQLIFETVPAVADPLGPENVLVLVAGPLGGTNWPGSGRIELAARSPLTGLWGQASVGGYFGTHLKRNGWDALVVRGASRTPVVLLVDKQEARLAAAEHLWGQDTYATEQRLKEEYGSVEVLSIGPAGERLVPMGSLVHHMGNDVAARCGLGAVAGSKRLKAIVVPERKQSVPVADPEVFRQLSREALTLFKQSDFLNTIRMGGGTASATPMSIDMNDMPARNWELASQEWKEEGLQITGQAMQAQWPSKKDTCHACPIACKWTVSAPQLAGGEAGNQDPLAGPEYESLAGLGAQTTTSDPLAVIQAADLCNRLGIDTISTGATIAWALEAHQKGLLTAEYIDDDLELRWGDAELVIELVRRIGENRPGLGALLAQGSKRAAEQIGAGLAFAIQVKGLELPFHHPQAFRGLEVAYATAPRGATHNEEGVTWDWEDSTYETWVGEIIEHMDLSGASSSMVYCQFLAGAVNAEYTAQLLTAATGVSYTPEDLLRAGERTWYLRRAFNLRTGVGLEADELPKRIVKQIAASPASLTDFSQALAEFHRQRDLDAQGVPSARKLEAVGLGHLVDRLDAK